MILTLFDTETTGLMDNRTLPLDKLPEIIEWYSCCVDLADGGRILWELDTLIRPKRPISAEITRITGLDDAAVANAPMFEAFAPLLKMSIETGPRMAAHNASYDIEMVEIEFSRIGQTIIWPTRPLCTVEATLPLLGYRLNLQGLHKHLFNAEFPNAHRAKNDVMGMLKCCVELFKRGEI
jgi:DNA polymerase-3 subunit epsilon